MSSLPGLLFPSKIGKFQFDELLAGYEPLVESISASKAKPGQKTLKELDRFRYVEAPKLFSQDDAPGRAMNHDDVKTLVDWKLRHGKFRPTLMKLVSSNDSASVSKTIENGITAYQKDSDVAKALTVLAKLKGIGPATASLLLAVHHPDDVPFFSDEAYYWLCNKGKKESLKYTMKEYDALIAEARALMKRLGVTAMDIEKVSYVVMKQEDAGVKSSTTSAKAPEVLSKKAKPEPQEEKPKLSTAAKRKTTTKDETTDQVPLRRSKRGKQSS